MSATHFALLQHQFQGFVEPVHGGDQDHFVLLLGAEEKHGAVVSGSPDNDVLIQDTDGSYRMNDQISDTHCLPCCCLA